MSVIFYKTAETPYAEKVLDTLLSVATDDQVHVADSLLSFIRALQKYRLQMPTVVTQVSKISDVTGIKRLSDILDGLFLIVAVDGHDERLLMNCRQLYPRLLTYHKENLAVLAAVVEKRMIVHRDHDSLLHCSLNQRN